MVNTRAAPGTSGTKTERSETLHNDVQTRRVASGTWATRLLAITYSHHHLFNGKRNSARRDRSSNPLPETRIIHPYVLENDAPPQTLKHSLDWLGSR